LSAELAPANNKSMSARHEFDIIVIGGGHAGIEAAWAAARMGARTALVTMRIEAIGRMSCNPAIGGLAKGQMVREIDALGGLMGLAADAAGIQFRMLNRRKGPAVWAPRAQADRRLYSRYMLERLRELPDLHILEGIVDELLTEPSPARHTGDGPRAHQPALTIRGIRLADERILTARAVVLTTGTFLRGLMHCGEEQTVGGRLGEPAAQALSDSLRRLGLRLARLKTGTPPRIHRDSVAYEQLDIQPGDEPPTPFSFMTEHIDRAQLPCWITYTNHRTHELIRANLHRAPMYSGQIRSRGPRYCPSIEDKVVRFADKDRHQVFLEPEGFDSDRIYCNGIPTSLPRDVQEPMVHSIRGLQHARILQYGYAIEYDHVPTDQIEASLQTKRISGLFLAGQINGTSGYEEAAGQGILAGINAVARLRGREPVILGRDQAYIGVMIDDLVTKPPSEPYRMFTSRAEYRLHLRSDNADVRLTPIGRQVGLVDEARWQHFQLRQRQLAELEALLASQRRNGRSLLDWLRRPGVTIHQVVEQLPPPANRPDRYHRLVLEQIEIRTKYDGYITRQARQIERFRRLESLRIPEGFDFAAIRELRLEAREKLSALAPRSLGQAARISGISPADLTVLWLYLDGRRRIEQTEAV